MVEGRERAARGRAAGRRAGVGADASGVLRFAVGRARPSSIRPSGRRSCAGPSIISPGATSWRNGAHADAAWDNLMLGLRRGERPRALVTTTPRPVPMVRRIRALGADASRRAGGRRERHCPAAYRDGDGRTYGGTRLGRQELDGVLFEEAEGALWPRGADRAGRARASLGRGGAGGRDGLEEARSVGLAAVRSRPAGVPADRRRRDAAAGSWCAGSDADGDRLRARRCERRRGCRPEGWARQGGRRRRRRGARTGWSPRENQGGDMVASVLRSVDAALPVRLVHASRGKVGAGRAGGGAVRDAARPSSPGASRSSRTSWPG